jgi:Fe2+ transport system protein FeoA
MQNKEGITSLTEVKDGQTGIIISVRGGRILTKRLSDLGLNPGTGVKIIGRTLFSGPLQIEVCGSRLVISKELALKIMVTSK